MEKVSSYSFKIKFEGKTKPITYQPETLEATCGDLRRFLESEYRISQTKILKLIKGQTVSAESSHDDIELRFLKLKPNQRIALMGSPLEVLDDFAVAEATGKIIQEEIEKQAEIERQRQIEEERLRLEKMAEQNRKRKELERQREEERRQRRPPQPIPPIDPGRAFAGANRNEIPSPGSNSEPFTIVLQAIQAPNRNKAVVNLPTNLLQDLVYHGAQTPYTFDITNTANGASTIAVAPTFDGMQGNIEIPWKLWEKFGLEDGVLSIEVNLRTRVVPGGEYAMFKSITKEWDHLTFSEQQALLELLLRHRQVLSQGEILELPYCDMLIRLEVTETRPAEVISILNTDLQTDFEPTEEAPLEIFPGTWLYRKSRPHQIMSLDHSLDPPSVMLRNLEGAEVGSELDRCTEHHPFVDLQIRPLEFNSPVKDTLPPDQTQYFAFLINDSTPRQLQLRSQNGDANIYVIHEKVISDSRWPLPSRSRYQWKGEEPSDQSIILSSLSSDFMTGVEYRVAVSSFKQQPVQYEISLTHAEEEVASMEVEVDKAGKQLCPHCGKYISQGAFMMHEMRCARVNAKCEICGLHMKRSDLDKHQKSQHEELRCLGCGVFLTSDDLQSHYKDCMQQLVHCFYCPLTIRREDRGDHHSECGNMKPKCPMCGDLFQRHSIKRHIHREHGVPLDMITYETWWS